MKVRTEPKTYVHEAPPRTGSSSATATALRYPVRSSSQSRTRRTPLRLLPIGDVGDELLVAQEHPSVLDLHRERVQPALGRSLAPLAVLDGEGAGVAGAAEHLGGLVVVDRAAE